MSIYHKETITQLTRDGLKNLIVNNAKIAILQIFDLEKITRKDDSDIPSSDKFKGFLSDGDSKILIVFGNSAAKVISRDRVKDFAVIQINDYIISSLGGEKLMLVVTNIDVINNDINEMIGEPQDWAVYEQNDYRNRRGSNQMPSKFVKNPTVLQDKSLSENMNTKSQSQMKVSKNIVSQKSYDEILGDSRLLINKLSKNNNFESVLYEKTNTAEQSFNKERFGKDGNKLGKSYNLVEEQTDDSNHYDLIKDLVGFDALFTIKARIIKKYRLRTYQKNGKVGHVFSIDLADKSAKIQASFFGEAAINNYPMLIEGHTYLFTNGLVKNANPKFNTVQNKYEITFETKTVITKVEDDYDDSTINAYNNFNFVMINQIEQTEIDSRLDIIAIIKTIGPCTEVSLRTGDTKPRRSIELCDFSLCTVELTIWGGEAEKFLAKEGDILLGSSLRVSEFKGKKQLSAGVRSQLFYEENLPNIPEVEQILTWRRRNEFKSISLSQSDRSVDVLTFDSPFTLEQIQEICMQTQKEKLFFDLRAHVTYIKPENMYYPSCPTDKCMKKVSGDDEVGWVCSTCGRDIGLPLIRYILRVVIEDNSDAIWASVFNEEAEMLFGFPARYLKELKEKGDETRVTDLIKEVTCQEWKIRLMAKIELINSEREIRYKVIKCSKVDFAYEARSLLKTLSIYRNI